MTKADQTVDSAADKLETFVKQAQASGGVKAKLGAGRWPTTPTFLRKLKPSLMQARAKGEAPDRRAVRRHAHARPRARSSAAAEAAEQKRAVGRARSS